MPSDPKFTMYTFQGLVFLMVSKFFLIKPTEKKGYNREIGLQSTRTAAAEH